MKVIYVQINNGDAHDGIDREPMLPLMGQDEPVVALAEHEGQDCYGGQAGMANDVGVLRTGDVSWT
jgi:hypothetical protein